MINYGSNQKQTILNNDKIIEYFFFCNILKKTCQ